jgi:hypothetical protein
VQFEVPPDGTPQERDQAAAPRAKARMSRGAQRQQREDRRAERDAASAARAQATKRRQAATPDTALALAFAQIAEHFYQADTFDEVLSRIAQAAVSTVVGCQLASVTMRQDGAFCTVASTHAAATEVDQASTRPARGLASTLSTTPSCTPRRFPTTGGRGSAPVQPSPACSQRSPTDCSPQPP